jgi:hypothetical protein
LLLLLMVMMMISSALASHIACDVCTMPSVPQWGCQCSTPGLVPCSLPAKVLALRLSRESRSLLHAKPL